MAEDPDILKTLEAQKLRLEIADLSRPMWRRAGFVLPFLGVLASVGAAHFTGWFDVQRVRLDNQRSDLRRDIASFEVQRTTLEDEVRDAARARSEALMAVALAEASRAASVHEETRAIARADAATETLRRVTDEANANLAALHNKIANLERTLETTRLLAAASYFNEVRTMNALAAMDTHYAQLREHADVAGYSDFRADVLEARDSVNDQQDAQAQRIDVLEALIVDAFSGVAGWEDMLIRHQGRETGAALSAFLTERYGLGPDGCIDAEPIQPCPAR